MAIQVIAQSATTTLLQPVGPVPVPVSEPACQVSGLDIEMPERPDCSTGLWECSPGQFRRQVASGEIMQILAGAGSFTSDAGETVRFSAGDTLVFPPNTRGVWTIEQTLRKLYVMA